MADTTFTLYELNQANMEQIKPLDVVFLKKACINACKNIKGYWMLLNRERADYTVFHKKEKLNDADSGEQLYKTLTNRGKVIDFTELESGAYEIWIRMPVVRDGKEETENFVYYLFEYNFGIVEV